MATSAYMNTSNSALKYTISVTLNSQDVANNTSNITVSVRFFRTVSGIETYGTGTVYCKIDGTTYSEAITPSQKINYNGIELFSKTLDVPHDADGTKTLVCSAWATHDMFTASEQSYSQTLSTIPRATVPTLSADTVNMGAFLTIYTNGASSKFTHSLTYSFGDYAAGIASDVSSSYNWQVPVGLASQIPNSTSGIGTITCHTYSEGKYIGSSTVNFIATLSNAEEFSPVISSITLSDPTGKADIYGGYVQSKSKVKVEVEASGVLGSTIKSYSITANGSTVSMNPYTSNVIAESGGVKVVSVTVTDSRGRTATSTATYTVLDYSSPTITLFNSFRCDALGNISDVGEYMIISWNAYITSLDNKNGKSFKIDYKKQSDSGWTTAAYKNDVYTWESSVIVPASTESTYYTRITVADDLSSANSKTSYVPTAFTLIDLNKSGKAMAIGKVSEKDDTFEVAMPIVGKKITTEAGVDLDELNNALKAKANINWTLVGTGASVDISDVYIKAYEYLVIFTDSNNLDSSFQFPYDRLGRNMIRGYKYDSKYFAAVSIYTNRNAIGVYEGWTNVCNNGTLSNTGTIAVYYR